MRPAFAKATAGSAATIVMLLAVLGGVLWYLRDPSWLIGQTTGFRPAERTPDGAVYRWSGGHASFFVPSDERVARIPIATTFDSRGAEPMVVTFWWTMPARRVGLTDASWQEVPIPLPPPGSRRVRRIDIRRAWSVKTTTA